jgi:hypothetical protein
MLGDHLLTGRCPKPVFNMASIINSSPNKQHGLYQAERYNKSAMISTMQLRGEYNFGRKVFIGSNAINPPVPINCQKLTSSIPGCCEEECKPVIIRDADKTLHLLPQGTLSNFCTNVPIYVPIY